MNPGERKKMFVNGRIVENRKIKCEKYTRSSAMKDMNLNSRVYALFWG